MIHEKGGPMTKRIRVGIDQDERWPTYYVRKVETFVPSIEVDEETLDRWKAAEEAFEAVQDEMAEAFSAASAELARSRAIAKAEKELAAAQARLEAARSGA